MIGVCMFVNICFAINKNKVHCYYYYYNYYCYYYAEYDLYFIFVNCISHLHCPPSIMSLILISLLFLPSILLYYYYSTTTAFLFIAFISFNMICYSYSYSYSYDSIYSICSICSTYSIWSICLIYHMIIYFFNLISIKCI